MGKRGRTWLLGYTWILSLCALATSAQDVRDEVRVKPQASAGTSASSSTGETEIDWSSVPPWAQTRFYGIPARGRVFAFVVDCSGSMADGSRLIRAKSELRRSILNLQDPQRYLIVFFNDEAWTGPSHGLPMPSDFSSKQRTFAWMRQITPEGTTNPAPALRLALSQKPDAVFFLTDGEFPTSDLEALRSVNQGRVPIHCIDLSRGAGRETLRRIAADSGGTYAER